MGFRKALVQCLRDYIQIPSAVEAVEIAQRWETNYCFTQAYGAIDGTHIPVTPPSDGYPKHVNRKGWPSVQLPMICDDRYV